MTGQVEATSPLAPPNRIAFAGDWHANTRWATRAVDYAAANNADVTIQLGDFGYLFDDEFLDALEETLDAYRMPLLFVDGNHENHKWLAEQPLDAEGLRPLRPHIFHLPRGFRWTWHGVGFVALGGAHSVDGIWRRQSGALWCREERLTEADVETAVAGGRSDVIVAHDCPDGVDIPDLVDGVFPPIEILRAEEHRKIVRQVVDAVRPTWYWHGHYHVGKYVRTPNFGWGTPRVVGLNCDGTSMDDNVDIVDMRQIGALVDANRSHITGG